MATVQSFKMLLSIYLDLRELLCCCQPSVAVSVYPTTYLPDSVASSIDPGQMSFHWRRHSLVNWSRKKKYRFSNGVHYSNQKEWIWLSVVLKWPFLRYFRLFSQPEGLIWLKKSWFEHYCIIWIKKKGFDWVWFEKMTIFAIFSLVFTDRRLNLILKKVDLNITA